jgi:hypothetical protein
MRPFLPLAFLLTAAPLLAQPHDYFSKDFPVSPCAPANSCESFDDSELPSAAFKFYGLTIDSKWVQAHKAAVLKELETACRRHATCMATPPNTYWFCDDVLFNETRQTCEKLFPGDPRCGPYLDTFLLGVDLRGNNLWRSAQACAAKLPPVTHSKPLEIWMVPEVLPAGFKGKVTFWVRDPDTHLPILTNFKFEDQIIYAPANPAGLPATIYPFDYTVKFKRVPNADGHSDIIPPMVTAAATGYPETIFRLSAEVPKMSVVMKPPADQLHRGKNMVIVEARDGVTGKPVEARVMFGDDIAGDTNKPISLDVARGKRPEIWVTSLFNTYSDVVVAKAR